MKKLYIILVEKVHLKMRGRFYVYNLKIQKEGR